MPSPRASYDLEVVLVVPSTFVKLPLVTLVDSLDALAIMGNSTEFQSATQRIWHGFPHKFNFDVNVSVFETTIRVLGGLLSGHLLAVDASLNLTTDYDGELFALALDLGASLARRSRLRLAYPTVP